MANASLLDRIFDPLGDAITPETAARLVDMQADEVVQRRIDELANRCTEGKLTEEERHEYDTYIRAIDFISIMQSKARKVIYADQSSR